VAAVALAVCVLGAAGCAGPFLRTLRGSGPVVSERPSLPSFDQIHASTNFQVHLSPGQDASVTLRFNENLRKNLDVSVSGRELRLGLRPQFSLASATLEADVTLPRLSRLELDGASQAQLEAGVETSGIVITASGASRVNGTLRSDQATLDLSGASAVDLIGNATNLTADASGASTANLPNLAVQMLSVDLSGASSAMVAVSGTTSAEVSGASHLQYGGNPTFTHRSATGASTIEPL
jgi:hypothetical protein